MSVQYLSVIISKIPELVNFISLQDMCHLRETCNDLKNEVDKKMIITRCDNRDRDSLEYNNYHKDSLQVTYGVDSYKKTMITDHRRYITCIQNPFNDDTYQWINDNYTNMTTSVISTIIEHNGNRRINTHIESIGGNDEGECKIEDLTKISDNHYHGTIEHRDIHTSCSCYYRSTRCRPLHYLKIKDQVVRIDDCLEFLQIGTTNGHIRHYIHNGDVIDGDIERNDNDPFWVAINIVLKMRQ